MYVIKYVSCTKYRLKDIVLNDFIMNTKELLRIIVLFEVILKEMFKLARKIMKMESLPD